MRANVLRQDTRELLCNVELQIQGRVTSKGTTFIAVLAPGDAPLGADPPEGLLIFETDTGKRYEGFSQSGSASSAGAYFRGTLALPD
jgi:hypothetical protein